MDPNATLRVIDSAGRIRERDCQQALKDLASWLRSGGFQPHWHKLPVGTQRFRKYYPHLIKPRFSREGRDVVDNGKRIVTIHRLTNDAGIGCIKPHECDVLAAHIVDLLNRFPPPGV